MLLIFIFFLELTYYLTAFTNFPGLSHLRVLWIETAMTTADHQWLATYLFPRYVIDDIMSKQAGVTDTVSDNSNIDVASPGSYDWSGDTDNTDRRRGTIIMPEREVKKVGDKDEHGNKIVIEDAANGLRAVEVTGGTFAGKVIIVDDPSQVVVRHTSLSSRGQTILEFMDEHDAIAGLNANGFADPDGHGKGDEILYWSMAGGDIWKSGDGSVPADAITMGFDTDNILIVGLIKDFSAYNFRDFVQFKPALIVNGELQVTDSAGWGVQPRSAIGQTADGKVVLVAVDGRQLHSVGATVYDIALIMQTYGVVNAGTCDGGSTTVMAYDGKLITKPSTPMENGRYLPNAILVLKR